jgi:hypothetical protein
MSENNSSAWAIAELMGHVTLVGKLTKPGEYGGLWQIDCPDESNNGGYHTEFFGSQSVYRIRLVSEEIALAYASSMTRTVIEYSAPIVTRAEHLNTVEQLREKIDAQQRTIYDLREKLYALPANTGEDVSNPDDGDYDPDEIVEDWTR